MPVDNGTAERIGKWLNDGLEELHQTLPRRGDGYVRDLHLPGSATPFRMFLGRDPQMQVCALPGFVETCIARGSPGVFVRGSTGCGGSPSVARRRDAVISRKP